MRSRVLKGAGFVSFFAVFALVFCLATLTYGQTGTFTFQGRLTDNSMTANGTYQMQFSMYDALSDGTQIGSTITNNTVGVTNGVFTVQLDFSPATPFATGADRWIEIAVRKAADPPGFTTLSPRQHVTSAPYATRASISSSADTATTATNATQLGGVAAANYMQTNGDGSGLTNLNASNIGSGTLADARLSSNVALKNASNIFTAAQTVNGNLTQTGTTTSLTLTNGFVTSGTVFSGSIPASGGGTRMMFYPGKAAFRAGHVIASQWDDANIGPFSTAMGFNTTASGSQSTAMGFGTTASGDLSTAMGHTTTASGNQSTAMGSFASTNGLQGSFVYGDSSAGVVNASAADQWTIRAAGGYRFFTNGGLTDGVFFQPNGYVGLGTTSPAERLHIVGNGLFTGNLTVSGTISATLPSGSTSYIQNQNAGAQASSNFNISGNGTAGGTLSGNVLNATTQFNAGGNRVLSSPGTNNIFAGAATGQLGNSNSFVGAATGQLTTGDGNTFLGYGAGISNTTGSNNTIIGYLANTGSSFTNATAIGNGASVNASNKVRLGNGAVTVIEGQVAYTFTSDKSSKENFLPVNGGDVLRKIRGFNMTSWNYKGQDPKQFRHYGPMAQDFYSAFGRDEIGTFGTPTTINSGDMAGVTLAAIKELATESEAMKSEIGDQSSAVSQQQKQIELLQQQVKELKALVCAEHKDAAVCQK